MPALRMIPGEAVVHRMHPSAWSMAPGYAVAVLHAALGVALGRLFVSPGWPQPDNFHWYQFWNYFRGNALIAFLLGALAMAAVVALVGLVLRLKTWQVVLDSAGMFALLVACVAAFGATTGVVLGVLIGAVLHAVAVEAHRLASVILVTDKRIVAQSGHKGTLTQARFADIADVDCRLDPVGRLLGSGTLVFVTQPHAVPTMDDEAPSEPESVVGVARHVAWPRIRGVHPVTQVKELVEALVQESTSPALALSARKKRDALIARLAPSEASSPQQP